MILKNTIGKPFIELSEVDSTNNYAMRQVQAHLAEHGTTWFARLQTAGRGQRGKIWKSARGLNITMSFVVDPSPITIDNQFFMNIFVALSCYDFFTSYGLSKMSIKWPNDIYWEDRKAGGILIDNVVQGSHWKYAIAGIGLNINQTLFPPELDKAVSLKQLTGKTFDLIFLAKQLCDLLDQRWNQLCHGDYAKMNEEYVSKFFRLGETVFFRKDEVQFEAKVVGLNDKGELMVEREKKEVALAFPVDWLISN